MEYSFKDNTYSRLNVNKILPNIFCKLLHKSLVVKIEMYSSIKYTSANFSMNVTSLQSKNLQFVFTSQNLDWKSPHRKQWAFTPAALLLGIVYSKHLMSVYPRPKGNSKRKELYVVDHGPAGSPTHFLYVSGWSIYPNSLIELTNRVHWTVANLADLTWTKQDWRFCKKHSNTQLEHLPKLYLSFDIWDK